MSLQLAQLRAQRLLRGDQQADGAAGRAEQRGGADREAVRIVVRARAVHRGEEAERGRERHRQDGEGADDEQQRAAAEHDAQPCENAGRSRMSGADPRPQALPTRAVCARRPSRLVLDFSRDLAGELFANSLPRPRRDAGDRLTRARLTLEADRKAAFDRGCGPSAGQVARATSRCVGAAGVCRITANRAAASRWPRRAEWTNSLRSASAALAREADR